jgi:hypothetical protein
LDLRRLIIPAGIVIGILIAVGIYLLVAPDSEKLVAQALKFDIPNPGLAVISISNKQGQQSIIAEMYPVFFGKKYSSTYAKSINATIEGTKLPLILNPGEVRVLKIHFSIEKKDLDQYADQLMDSTHIVVFQNGPPPGQLEGFVGLGWRVVDADGQNYTNTARLAYYVLTPSPHGFADPTSLTRSGLISDDPFELCKQENIATE